MSHPFAQYIQILGKGKRGARDLTLAEAEAAMHLVVTKQIEPEQLGAFLMLMRVKEETAEEVAGFVRASRVACAAPAGFPVVELDWASYAGKRRQLPWFVLSALLLSSHGINVLMHGLSANIPDRVYATDVLRALGIHACADYAEAAQQLQQRHFAFIPLEAMSGELKRIIDLKATLGLRSPIHTVARMLNPAAAATSIMGIFHPGYDQIHQSAAHLLQDNNMAVFKGEGGESERNPDATCQLRLLLNGEKVEETWDACFSSRHVKDETMDVSRMALVWRGVADEYAEAAIISTAAIALRAMGRATDMIAAEQLARDFWQQRNLAFFD